jgi:hypothetical protein
MAKLSKQQLYEDTCQMAWELILAWPIFHGVPLFAYPPAGIALIAALPDVKRLLARNDSARELCDALAAETKRRRLPDEPTAMMILVALEHAGVPIKTRGAAAVDELGPTTRLKGRWPDAQRSRSED